jgi:ABC-type taurine transport system substrate-binding protein
MIYNPPRKVTVAPVPDIAVTLPRTHGAVDIVCVAAVADATGDAANVIVVIGYQLTLSVEPSTSTEADTALAPDNVA